MEQNCKKTCEGKAWSILFCASLLPKDSKHCLFVIETRFTFLSCSMAGINVGGPLNHAKPINFTLRYSKFLQPGYLQLFGWPFFIARCQLNTVSLDLFYEEPRFSQFHVEQKLAEGVQKEKLKAWKSLPVAQISCRKKIKIIHFPGFENNFIKFHDSTFSLL